MNYKKLIPVLVVFILPSLLVSLLFYILLGHRRDYLGHYAAGFGGTLCAISIALAIVPASGFDRSSSLAVVICTVACIAAGTLTESTIFRLAKFDEVDYCNQNLGAVVAGLAAIHVAARTKPTDGALRSMIATGAVFLVMGAYFAVT